MTEMRVAPLGPDELDDAQRAFLAPFTDRRGRYPNIFGVLCRDMPLMNAWRDFGLYLMKGSRVDPVLREILILRTAHQRGSAYEWHQHRRVALALGLSEAQLAQIAEGSDLGDDDRNLMIRCVDDLVRDTRLSDACWAAMTDRFGLEYTLDAIFTVGAYTALAMGLNSCDVAIEERRDSGTRQDT